MNFPIREIALGDKEYPKLLAQISDPPAKLYCRGNIELLNTFCISVVGTRKITAYGKEAVDTIVGGLNDTGWTIVSGLALGIDAVAHQAALDNNLPTIAVLGSPVTDAGITPRTNVPLAMEILDNNGLLISEYEKPAQVFASNFAVRDRITSGLSKGVVIIEGAEHSGSLITARSAADQNRDVFAVPGNIFSNVSKGTNELIKNGAKMVTSANDILEEYQQNLKLNFGSGNDISTKDPVQKKIIDILDEKGELSADEIIRGSELEASVMIAAISMLELKNKIIQRNGKYQLKK
jgi:DNA processing protein